MKKKYILTDETITLGSGIVLHRIKAIRSFGDVNEGDLGGWIEKDNNLSHEGNCWVYGNAYVYGHAKVCGNVCICDDAIVCDNATVYDNATVCDNATVYGNTRIFDYAKVHGNVHICDNAIVRDNAEVFGNATVYGNTRIFDYAKIHGHAEICGDAEIYGNAVIQSDKDYIVFKNWWSSGRYFTWTRSNNMWRVGCFYGTGEELVKKAYKDSEISGKEYERIVKYVESILKEEEK